MSRLPEAVVATTATGARLESRADSGSARHCRHSYRDIYRGPGLSCPKCRRRRHYLSDLVAENLSTQRFRGDRFHRGRLAIRPGGTPQAGREGDGRGCVSESQG